MSTDTDKTSCIILAGGEGKRVDGRNKGLIEYQGKPLIQHVIDAVATQTDEIIISANRNLEEYRAYGYSVIADDSEQYRGPMAGIAAAMPACKYERVLVVPCDMPFLPDDIIETLSPGMETADVCIAESENRLQLVFLLHIRLLPSLQQSLQNDQLRLMQWIKAQRLAVIPLYETQCFRNINHTSTIS